MSLKRAAVLVAVATIVAASGTSVRAVDGPVVGHASFGASLPMGDAGDALDDGWAFHGGATWFSPSRPNLGLRMDLGIDWWDVKRSVLDTIDTEPGTPNSIQPPDNGDARVWSGTVDVLWSPNRSGTVGFYLVGGVGLYYAQAQISEVGYASGIYCDPWWGWCYPGTVAGDIIIDDRSDWNWGANVGAGLTFRTGASTEIYLEAVYHWMDSDKGTEWMPINVGVRW